MKPTKTRKTPSDVTEFEREQLRFFLSRADVAQVLAELNPSLAWLPELARMKVIQSPAQLTPWIEKNFGDAAAVREVSANLEFFDERAADLLELRLNRQIEVLPPLLVKSWQLIIRHIRNNPTGLLRSEWYDIQPRIKAGEHSADLLERLARVLRPVPKVSKRISWPGADREDAAPGRPSDLFRLEYEVGEDVSDSEVLAAWPADASAATEQKFLTALVDNLGTALADAVEMEVETNSGYGISDSDVPSVAAHQQDEHRRGFLPITRVIAEIWTKLASKDVSLALPFVARWSSSPMKLNKRLALFAATNEVVAADDAADVLLTLPQLLLFLGASVEVVRLIHQRWGDFSKNKRASVEKRFLAGPPSDAFSSDADVHVDRSRFDVLGDMERAGLELSDKAKSTLAEIKNRHPIWELRPAEQAGFHTWFGSAHGVVGDPQKFVGVSSETLVDEAKKLADNADFSDGDDWQALCQSDPERALAGLEAKATKNEWPVWAWNPFLWAAQELDRPDSVSLVGGLLLTFPDKELREIASTATWWLSEKAKALNDDILWPLWDKLEAATAAAATEPQDE